jgi:intracellular multiplication protein IcmJ
VRLLPLTLSAQPTATISGAKGGNVPCAFCGVRSGKWLLRVSADGVSSCPLCTLSLHLTRPRIDDEAALVWLPEMSQQAINTMIRHIHLRLRRLGEDVRQSGRLRQSEPEQCVLHNARAILHARGAAASSRLGTDTPSELASALLRLSEAASASRASLLGGLRLLPLGRFYQAGQDVYPAILDDWLAIERAAEPALKATQ